MYGSHCTRQYGTIIDHRARMYVSAQACTFTRAAFCMRATRNANAHPANAGKGIVRQGIELKHGNRLQKEPVPCRVLCRYLLPNRIEPNR